MSPPDIEEHGQHSPTDPRIINDNSSVPNASNEITVVTDIENAEKPVSTTSAIAVNDDKDATPTNEYINYLRSLYTYWQDAPSFTISYTHLSYTLDILPSDASEESSLPSITKSLFGLLKSLTFQFPKKTSFKVFQDCNGVIDAGKMTLILAPPGSGKSAFLKALSGRLSKHTTALPDSNSNQLPSGLSGNLWYNGLTFDDQYSFNGLYMEKLLALIAQGNTHMANLTVKETLQFVYNSAVAELPEDAPSELKALHKRKIDLLIKALKMEECTNTIAGNDVLRGISGGQKRRLTIAEMMITNARILFLDEPTTGLDAAVARDLMIILSEYCSISKSSCISALLQPTPEVYELYDELILLMEGQIVYQGPREDVETYLWEHCGIESDPNQDIADLIVDFLSDPEGVYQRQMKRWHKLQSSPNTPANAKRCTTVEMLVNTYHASRYFKHQLERINWVKLVRQKVVTAKAGAISEMEAHSSIGTKALATTVKFSDGDIELGKHKTFIDESKSTLTIPNQNALYTKTQFMQKYNHSFLEHTTFAIRRQFTLMKRDTLTIPPRLFNALFISLVLGSTFFQTDSAYNKYGMLLYALLNSAMGNFIELPDAFEGRNTLWKHVDTGFYPTASYIIAVSFCTLPVMILETLLMTIPLYFMVGLANDAGRFFFFMLLLLLTDVFLALFYRTFCYLMPTMESTQHILDPIFSFLVLFGGFMITREKIPNFLIEFYWLSPFSWVLRSLAQNEFQDVSYSTPASNTSSITKGDESLILFEVQTDPIWKWMGVVYLVGFLAVCLLLSSYFLITIRYDLLQGTKRRSKLDDGVVSIEIQPPTPQNSMNVSIPTKSTVNSITSLVTKNSRINSSTSVLPFQPATLVFENIQYTISIKEGKTSEDKRLLTDIKGYVCPGQLVALMGSSGAGKTTLMDVICGRKTSGKIEGNIYINGHLKEAQSFARISGYVEQQDLHMPLYTVRESLVFSATLRLPRSVTDQQREKFVDEILDLLELKSIQHRLVGNQNYTGLSPGQLKLLTIGVELVANPSILFLDEPTSGLDSRAALVVMQVVKNIAATGRTILCTIHQPSSEVFSLFDRLLLLQPGGRTSYFGDIGENGDALVDYFRNHTSNCIPKPPKMNPASWILDVLNTGSTLESNSDASASNSENYANLFLTSASYATAEKEIQVFRDPKQTEQIAVNVEDYGQTLKVTMYTVYKRVCVSYWRDSNSNFGMIMTLFVLGLILGLLFLQVNDDDYPGMNSKIGAITSLLIFSAMMQMQLPLPGIIADRAVYYREQATKCYPSWIYSSAISLIDLPLSFVADILFMIPFYFLVGLRSDGEAFFRIFLALYLLSLFSTAFGQACGVIFPSFIVAIQVLGFIMTFGILFSGLFIRANDIPVGWKWVYYINPFPKAIIASLLTEFECHSPDPYSLSSDCPRIKDENNQEITKHAFINKIVEAGYSSYWNQIAYLIAFVVFFRLVFMLSLHYINHVKR